jgi:hypothetical protein
MSSSIGLFADLEDYQALIGYARSIGLSLVESPNDAPTTDPSVKPGCYLSPVPEPQLHTIGNPPRYSYGLDPLLIFQRPYYQAPYLVAGFIQWSTDRKEFAAVTKSPYQRLRRWVMKEWIKPEGDSFYCGPRAMELVAQGAERVNVLPSAKPTFTVVIVPSSSKSDDS